MAVPTHEALPRSRIDSVPLLLKLIQHEIKLQLWLPIFFGNLYKIESWAFPKVLEKPTTSEVFTLTKYAFHFHFVKRDGRSA